MQPALCYTDDMKIGAFIIPTGIGASIGGFAGDASVWARKFAKKFKLIVNPNVVNAACFSGITESRKRWSSCFRNSNRTGALF